jgi:hypothetical protein
MIRLLNDFSGHLKRDRGMSTFLQILSTSIGADMNKGLLCMIMASYMMVLFPVTLVAQDKEDKQERRGPQTGWSTFSRGGAVHQFDTDLDEGGSYNASRFNIQVGQGYAWDPRTSVSLALSYSYDAYSFSDGSGAGIAARNPWDNINSFSLSTPMRMGIDESWSAFLIPSLRSTGESGASFDETLTGGVFAGAAYRFGDSLTIGPGIGVISQLEERATIFPVLIITWKITDQLSLETGRGLAATLGPGLTLNYRANQMWNFAVGGRYEKLRFRLDKDATISDGIGEDRSFPLFASCTYNFNPKTTMSLVGGIEFGGELKLEDEDGNSIIEESYDPAGFLGLTFNMRL